MAETQISPVIHKVSKKAGKATTKSHNEMTPRNVIKKLNVLDTAPNLLPAIHLFRISRAECQLELCPVSSRSLRG